MGVWLIVRRYEENDFTNECGVVMLQEIQMSMAWWYVGFAMKMGRGGGTVAISRHKSLTQVPR